MQEQDEIGKGEKWTWQNSSARRRPPASRGSEGQIRQERGSEGQIRQEDIFEPTRLPPVVEPAYPVEESTKPLLYSGNKLAAITRLNNGWLSGRTLLRLCPILSVLLITLALDANAVVVRHDVSDAKYHAEDKAIPALADIPCEGHGVLIAPRWVVTAAHVVTWQHEPIGEVTINGKPRKVARVIVHSGYKPMIPIPPKGDITPFHQFLASRDDIALIELQDEVADVEPMPMYKRTDELGKLVTFFGKGATGDGMKGVDPHASHRTRLRQGFNQVSMAEGKWLGTVFDKGPDAHPLEAYTGGGDSGGPLVIERDNKRWLAGLASYSYCEGDIADCKPGFYGSQGRQVRVSAYADWIEKTIREQR